MTSTRIIRTATIADSHIQKAIGSKGELSAIVVKLRFENLQENNFTSGIS